MRRPHGQAVVDPDSPEQFAICDRCARQFNRSALRWQKQWAGPTLIDMKLLVCERCLDEPAPFQRTIVLPMDPPPVYNARHEGNLAIDGASHYTARPAVSIIFGMSMATRSTRVSAFMLGGAPFAGIPFGGNETVGF